MKNPTASRMTAYHEQSQLLRFIFLKLRVDSHKTFKKGKRSRHSTLKKAAEGTKSQPHRFIIPAEVQPELLRFRDPIQYILPVCRTENTRTQLMLFYTFIDSEQKNEFVSTFCLVQVRMSHRKIGMGGFRQHVFCT